MLLTWSSGPQVHRVNIVYKKFNLKMPTVLPMHMWVVIVCLWLFSIYLGPWYLGIYTLLSWSSGPQVHRVNIVNKKSNLKMPTISIGTSLFTEIV